MPRTLSDKCEVDRDLAMKVNFEGTINIAKVARKKGFLFLFISLQIMFFMVIGAYTVKTTILIL